MTKQRTNQRACRVCHRGKALQGVRCRACQVRLDAAIASAIAKYTLSKGVEVTANA
jgi:hypothetical protein